MNPRITTQPPILCLIAMLLTSCASAPSMAPSAAAADIAERLAADDVTAANARFDEISRSNRHREVAFTVLYEQAQGHYERADYESAIRFLRFLEMQYPRARSPSEALLYALFLERARSQSKLDKATLDEMDALAVEMAKREGGAPVWLDLISSQIAIDQERYRPARAALARFRARWDGEPSHLEPYVVELDRFLSTHREDTR